MARTSGRSTSSGSAIAAHVGAEAVLLVEVAESSLMYDRTTKASIYAKAQIAEYWIVFPADVAMG